jgi:hypothetical protein
MSKDNDTRFAWCNGELFNAHLLAQKVKLNHMMDVDADRKKTFKCCNPSCQDELVLCVTMHERYRSNGYFRHKSHGTVVAGSKEACGSKGDGESAEHLQAKFYLLEKAGLYTFDIGRCTQCERIVTQSTSNSTVSLEEWVKIGDAFYVFDAVLRIPHRRPIVMEVWHKHKTPPQKIDAIRSINWDFAEFDANVIINRLQHADEKFAPNRHVPGVHDLIGLKCGMCLRNAGTSFYLENYQNEVRELIQYEECMYDYYVLDSKRVREWNELKAKHRLSQDVLKKLHQKKHTLITKTDTTKNLSLLELRLKVLKTTNKTNKKPTKKYTCIACDVSRDPQSFVSVSKDRISHLIAEKIGVFEKVDTIKICNQCTIKCPWCKENDCLWGDIMYYGVCRKCRMTPHGQTLQCEEILDELCS